MKAKFVNYGPWQIPICVKHCLCSDGVRRYVRITGEPDTFFSIPGVVQVKGHSVSGFVTGFVNEQGENDYKFIAYGYRKNGHLLPE